MTNSGKKWSQEEIKFLTESYPAYGSWYCSDKLQRGRHAILRMARRLKIKSNKIKLKYSKENLKKIIEICKNFAAVLNHLKMVSCGGNYNTIKYYINKYKIDISHFTSTNSSSRKKISLENILIENSEYSRTRLKERLYKDRLKERRCELCGQEEMWNGKKMSLILDHINGIHNDNRLENLRIVCPNCNATLDTHCRGNKKRKRSNSVFRDYPTKKIKILQKKCICGKEIRNESKQCEDCYHKNTRKPKLKFRKVERPPLQQLLQEVKEIGYSATGRKYGVSDKAIRKWIKSYEEYGI